MGSNKQLTSEALTLAKELGEDIKTDSLNNAELAALVSDLKAKQKGVTSEAKTGYFVANGKAITSNRGILSDGDEIEAADLAGGKKALAAFVKSGHVSKA